MSDPTDRTAWYRARGAGPSVVPAGENDAATSTRPSAVSRSASSLLAESDGFAGSSYPSWRGRGGWWVRVRRAKAASAVVIMTVSQAVLWISGLKVVFRVKPAARLVWREP